MVNDSLIIRRFSYWVDNTRWFSLRLTLKSFLYFLSKYWFLKFSIVWSDRLDWQIKSLIISKGCWCQVCSIFLLWRYLIHRLIHLFYCSYVILFFIPTLYPCETEIRSFLFRYIWSSRIMKVGRSINIVSKHRLFHTLL